MKGGALVAVRRVKGRAHVAVRRMKGGALVPLRCRKGGAFGPRRGTMRRALLLAAAFAWPLAAGAQQTPCVPVGQWIVPGGGAVNAGEVFARAARQSVVLLGERHDSAEDHRWQLGVLAALHARRPELVLAFEMFPRRVQPALDRWTRGELSEAEFLDAAEWREVWGFDAALYLPLFHFARMHRLPMVAANVDRTVTREVAQKGIDAVPSERRDGVGRGAAPSRRYLDLLVEVYGAHQPPDRRSRSPAPDDAEFRRFVDAQVLWDRALAEAIAGAQRARPQALVVGVMGRGHVQHGDGVAHQLRDLGIADTALLLPWDRDEPCSGLVAGLADAVFGVATPPARAEAPRPRLGVMLEPVAEGVRVQRVDKGSLAEASGLRDGDVIVDIAGRPAKQAADVADAVRRVAPGTWLPVVVRRGGARVELIARFPAIP
jgi:uncharacterized iron-regulated protein